VIYLTAGSGTTVDVCKEERRRVIEEAKRRILVLGKIEQEGLIFTFAALNTCSLCVSPMATTRNRKVKLGLLSGLAMKEVKPRKRSYQS